MSCTINQIQLSFDKDSRVKNVISRVANYNMDKATMLAAYSFTPEFLKFVGINISESDILKGNNVLKDDSGVFTPTVEDLTKINANKLYSLYDRYYKSQYKAVENFRTKKGNGRLNGFTTISAKRTAKAYSAYLIKNIYRGAVDANKHPDSKKVIKAVNDAITQQFYQRAKEYADIVLANNEYSEEAKNAAREFLKAIDKVNEFKKSIQEYTNEIAENEAKITANKAKVAALIKERNDANEAGDKVTRKLKNKELKETDEAITNLRKRNDELKSIIENKKRDTDDGQIEKLLRAEDLIFDYPPKHDDKYKASLVNYANLMLQTRANADEWYFQVFNTKDMTSIVKDVNTSDIQDYLDVEEKDGDIELNYNGDNYDKFAASWDSSMYKNINSAVSSRIRLVLSTVPRLNSPIVEGQEVDMYTNNELGVAEFMDAQYLINQIFSNAKTYNRKIFIKSLEESSRSIPELYGLGEVVAQMKANPVFLNEMFANFSKPLIKKTILTIEEISSKEGIVFDYSNPNSDKFTAMFYKMSNKIRNTYYDAYKPDDISKLQQIINKGNVTESIIALNNLFTKYFPSVDNKAIKNYVESASDKQEAIKNVANQLANLTSNSGIVALRKEVRDDEINKIETYNRLLKQYNEALTKHRKDPTVIVPEKPVREYVRISDHTPNTTMNKAMIQLSKLLMNYTDSKVKLNSANAEGNQSADIAKNCYATRMIEHIQAETEEDSFAGAKNTMGYFTQGMQGNKKNQYFYNPILFGLRDMDGNYLKGVDNIPGLFIKTANGFEVNPNIKSLIDINLFDGTKNVHNKDGAGYASMGKLDFFISQYFAYQQSTRDLNSDNITTDVDGIPTANYPMRIGSDAPKIYMIKSVKYNYRQLQYAFYNHLMNEILIMTKGLNAIFTDEYKGNLYLRTDTNGLIDRIHYNKNLVEIKNGQPILTGAAFKLQRLFDVQSEKNKYYSANELLMDKLSLYGREGIVKTDEDGRVYLDLSNPNSLFKRDEVTGKVEFNPTDAHKKEMMQIVMDWMNNYQREIALRTQSFTKTMNAKGVKYEANNINMYLLNCAQMNMAYDDIFEGDFKLYKDARDFLKRTKEVQAGGDAYAAYDLTEEFNSKLKDLNIDGNLENIGIQVRNEQGELVDYTNTVWENGKFVQKPMIARNGFRAVTIYNTKKTVDRIDLMQKKLEAGYIKQGISKDMAYKMSVDMASGFGLSTAERDGAITKINDAQSYITFEEFIRRCHADGTLNNYKEIIDKILDPNVRPEEIDIKELNSQIQVRKNFYYDKIYDAETDTFYSRQIKNAEFVLIPKLLPENSELRQVYDWMIKNDIGQLNTAETSKAGNKNIFTVWDERTGELAESFLEEQNKQGNVEDYVGIYEYKYLYKQQDVPHHIGDTQNKAAIQIMKKIVDNVYNEVEEDSNDPELKANRKKVIDLAEDFQRAFSANIKEDFYNFIDMIGWKYDANTGKISNKDPEIYGETLDFSDFYARAREEAARLGMDSNFIEYLIPDPITGMPTMPNWMNTVSGKLESIAQAMFNRTVTRQVLPGWHAAQITQVGYSDELEFDPETGVMDVYLPRWSNLIPKGKTPEEDAEIFKQIQKEGLTIQLGYRIPTEGKQSIAVLHVKGFVNEALGSTIVVPNAWVTQTGSDFDVDSVYGISWEMYTERDENGKLIVKKIPFTEETINKEALYIDYVKRHLENKINRPNVRKEIKEQTESLYDELKDNQNTRKNIKKLIDEINTERQNLFSELPVEARSEIIHYNNREDLPRNSDGKQNIRITYPELAEILKRKVLDDKKVSEKLTNEDKANIQIYINDLIAISEQLQRKDAEGYISYNSFISNKDSLAARLLEEDRINTFNSYQDAAAKEGLMSFEEWDAQDIMDKLSKKARNNRILHNMIEIMNNDNSKEEQFGRSQFEDLAKANAVIDKLYGKNKKDVKQSPYNPLDQLDYFNDVMGGARLKALSVNWDTFASKVNRLRAYLSEEDAIEVILNVEGVSATDSDISYVKDMLKESYGDEMQPNTKSKNIKLKKYRTKGLGEVTKTFTIHTGVNKTGKFTKGGDASWVEIGREFGMTEVNGIGPKNYDDLSNLEKDIIEKEYQEVCWDLGRPMMAANTEAGKYTRRDYMQIDNAQQIFAVGDIINPGEIGSRGIPSRADHQVIDGGTGYGVQYAIRKNKEVHVFNQRDGLWYEWSKDKNKFIPTTTPVIKGDFAGIGTRDITSQGINAIRNVYENSIYGKINIINNNSNNVETNETDSNGSPVEGQVRLTVSRIGWSNNNRNIVGKLCTTYTAQTTAHHLDAVKEGSIENVDEYTFNTYKLLASLGLDYETVIAFIRQPVITRIVNNNNLVNSIFFKSNENPIDMSIQDIFGEMGLIVDKEVVNETTSIYDIFDNLKNHKEFVGKFNDIFGIDISHMTNSDLFNVKVPLSKQQLFDRIKSEVSSKGHDKVGRACFDFAMLLTFRNIKNTANKVSDYITISAADKTGAGSSLRDVKKIVDKVKELRNDKTLSRDGKGFVDLIYPLNENGFINTTNSEFESIATIYNYATLMSQKVNTQLFITANEDFDKAEQTIVKYIGRKLTDAEYKEFKKFVISRYYMQSPKLLSNFTINERGQISQLVTDTDELYNREYARIFGYGVDSQPKININDINQPDKITNEDLAAFNALTPAQKVQYIQEHLTEGNDLFKSINVTYWNPSDVKSGKLSRNYISFDNTTDNVEDMLYLFEEAFFSHNRLIKSAAIDLIKYAFIAEGFDFKSGYISKIVPNSVLTTDVKDGGFDIISEFNSGITSYAQQLAANEDFVMEYVRAHSSMIKINSKMKGYPAEDANPNYDMTVKFNQLRSMSDNGLVAITNNPDIPSLKKLINNLQLNRYNERFIRLEYSTGPNSTTTTLYRVHGVNPITTKNVRGGDVQTYSQFYLIPINTLDINEHTSMSFNANNNKYNLYEEYLQDIERLSPLLFKANNLNTENSKIKADDIKAKEENRAERTKVNQDIKEAYRKLSKQNYNPEGGYSANDPFALEQMTIDGNDKLKGGARKLLYTIIKEYEKNGADMEAFAYIPNAELNSIFPAGVKNAVEQVISTYNGRVIFRVERYDRIKTEQVIYQDHSKTKNTSLREAINEYNLNPNIVSKTNIYRITAVRDEKNKTEVARYNAASSLLTDDTETEPRLEARTKTKSTIDNVSRTIMEQISFDAIKNRNKKAIVFNATMNRKGISKNNSDTRIENRDVIYTSAAKYYKSAASDILNRANNFEINGRSYKIDEPALYEELINNDFKYPELANLIMDGITFGNRIRGLFELDITAEDKQTRDGITSIMNTINDIHQNAMFKKALDHIFNIYMKKYSTNPEIVNDILKLREAFGDTEAIDAWITDPAEIQNPQVQVVIKKVQTILNKAEMFDSVKAEKEFRDKVKEITDGDGTLDMNKIIDIAKGRIRQDFIDDFIKERDRLFNEYNETRILKHKDFEHYKKYIDAKLARDEFMFKYTNQIFKDDYYRRDIEMRKEVIKLAGDYYYKYMQLSEQFYAVKDISSLSEDELRERDRLKAQMDEIRTRVYPDGEIKPYAEERAALFINQYLDARKKLNKEYFKYQEYDGFQEDYQRYSEVIQDFDKENPHMPLERKLADPHYKEAYDWISNNGKIDFRDDVKEKINNAFKTLTGHEGAISNARLKSIRSNPELLDEFGHIDPTKLNDDQIALLKQEEENDAAINYDNGYGEMILIKSIPDNLPTVDFGESLSAEEKERYTSLKYPDNKEKARIIGEINKILLKVIDVSNGYINMSMLFNDDIVSNDERERLGNLYEELRNLRKDYDWSVLQDNDLFSEELNTDAVADHRRFKATDITDPAKEMQWYKIFTIEDTHGNNIPNPLIYAYRVPKPGHQNVKKDEARNYLKDNVRFVVTDKYIQKDREMSAMGPAAYNAWYKANHIYNVYNHRYEPLKIWTKMEAVPGSEAAKTISYNASFNNMERTAKEDTYNKKYNEYGYNYRTTPIEYTDSEGKTISTRDTRYDANLDLTDKEKDMRKLYIDTLNKYATSHQGKTFVNRGYLPRDRKAIIDWKYGVQQGMSLLGLSWHSGADSDSWNEQRDYSHDREVEMKMLSLIKGKGTRELIKLPNRNDFDNEEEYLKEVKRIKEENTKIIANNEAIDNKYLNTNWNEVMAQFVHNAVIVNARENIKPYLYLLLEDLKENKAYMLDGYWNKHVVKDSINADDNEANPRYEEQKQTYELLHNYTRRLIFEQYHKNSLPRTVANFMQNMASAKYMVFNLYGGIANITTGEVNIGMEYAANEYFGKANFLKANKEYLANIPHIIASMRGDKSASKTVAFMKEFNVVDFDQVLQFGAGSEGLEENLRRVRNWLYGFQSGGEHLMQNSVLLAMLDSHRLYTDANGVRRIGSLNDYVTNIENQAMIDVLGGNEELLKKYKRFKVRVENDLNKKYNIVSGRQDYNRMFLNTLRTDKGTYRNIGEAYHKKRKELLKDAEGKFNSADNTTVRELFDFENGKLVLKQSIANTFYTEDGKLTNSIGSLEDLISAFKAKVIATNKKIHGVYDKNGAAQLEKKWYGSLIMQYHKHLYTGIMKRWRRRGYYSELRGTRERGTMQTLLDFMGTEFYDFNDRTKLRMSEHDTNVIMASIQVAMESIVDSAHNLTFNWNNLSEWERANIKRNFADACGALSACLFTIVMYGMWDDDEIKDDGFKSSLLYLADRLYQDSTMYSPIGLTSEYKTLWSSPIASANSIADAQKAMTLIPQALFDPDYNPEYSSGQYAGKNKLSVLIRRNMPGVRPWDRIQNITRSNKYYKIDSSHIGINWSKNIGEMLHN